MRTHFQFCLHFCLPLPCLQQRRTTVWHYGNTASTPYFRSDHRDNSAGSSGILYTLQWFQSSAWDWGWSACGGAIVTVHPLPRYVPTRRMLQPWWCIWEDSCTSLLWDEWELSAGSSCCKNTARCLASTPQNIKSSNNRVKLLEVGSNVRIPILTVDRAPIGPTSLVDVVPDVSSTGNTFRLDTQRGQIPTWFSHSDVTPCGGNLLLSPSAVPDVELSVRTAARQKVGPVRTKCNCKTSCTSTRCSCYKQRSRKSCITGRGTWLPCFTKYFSILVHPPWHTCSCTPINVSHRSSTATTRS